MIDDLSPARPQSGFNAASVVWQAPAEGGIPRYMMIFQENIPTDVGPVRSSRYYYIAWAAEWRAVYAHAGGSPQALADAPREGQRPARLQRRRVPLGRLVPAGQEPLRAAQPVHRRQAAPQRSPRRVGAKDGPIKPAWTVRPGPPLERPGRVGGRIQVAYPTTRSATTTTARRTRTCARSPARSKQIDAATEAARRAEERRRHADAVRAAQRRHPQKHRLEAKVVGSGTAWIATNGEDDQGHVAQEDVADGADPVLRRGRQAGHADRRPDVRPGHADRVEGRPITAGQARRRPIRSPPALDAEPSPSRSGRDLAVRRRRRRRAMPTSA